MPTSKKSRKPSAVIHLQCWSGCENLVSREKKSAFYKKQAPKQVETYLEKIKGIPKEKLVYIDETGIQTQMYRQYARSKRGKRVNIRISGKRHARIGLVAAQRESALLAPHTYRGRMKASVFEEWFENKLLKKLPKDHVIIMDYAAFHKKEVLYQIAKKYSQTLIFFAAVFAVIQSHWAHVERFEAKGCWLCSSIWFRFTGSGCRFKRQLAIICNCTNQF